MILRNTVCFSILFVLVANAQQFRPIQLRHQLASTTTIGNTDLSGTEDAGRDVQSTFESVFQYGISFGKRKGSVIPQLTHKIIGQNFNGWGGQIGEPETSRLTRLAINAVFPVNDRWSLLGSFTISQGVNPNVEWNFRNNFYRYGSGFLINTKAGNRIGAGVRYVEEIGFPAPLFLFFGTSKSKKWYYNIAFPAISTVEYGLNNRWQLRFLERIDNDRFILNSGSQLNFNLTSVNVSIGLSHELAKSFFVILDTGVTPINFMTFFYGKTNDIGVVNLGLQPTIGASFYYKILTQ